MAGSRKKDNKDIDKNSNKNTNKNGNRNTNRNKNTNRNSNAGKETFINSNRISAVDTVILLYLTYLSTFYLIYMHDMYFDITLTRAKCFIYGTVSLIIAAILAYILEMIIHSAFIFNGGYKGGKNKNSRNKNAADSKLISLKGVADYFEIRKESDIKLYEKPAFYAVIFIISQAAATFINAMTASKNDKIYLGLKYALTGERGRRLGLMMMLLIFIMFIIISYGIKSIRCIYPITMIVSLYMFYIAYLQHFGTDYKGWRKQIKASQKTIFMSTIGNMNTFGSYLCLFLAVSLAVFIFTKKYAYRFMSGAGIVAGAFTIMTAKSDNVYLGTGTAMILLFYVAVRRKKLMQWTLALLLISSGLFIMSILDSSKKGSKGHLNGIAKIVGNPKMMGIFLAASAVLFVIFLILKLKMNDRYERMQNKWLIIGVTAAGILAVIIVTVIGIRGKNELFVFNDRWGEYRGYIWKRSCTAYGRGSFLQKLFGYGNETVRDVMNTYYHDEMVEITGKVYDSCHNVILNRILTTGLFGLLAYLGLFIGSMRYMLKYSEGRAEVLACAAASAAYFAEALVNPEQPITTPLFFVFLAVGVGLVRYKRRQKN